MSVPPPASSASAAQRGFPWWSPFAALFAALAASVVVAAIIAGVAGEQADDLSPGVILTATFIQDALLIAAMLGISALNGVKLTPATFGLRKSVSKDALPLAIGVFIAFYIFLIAWSRLQPSAKDDLLDDLGAKTSTASAIAVAVLVCVVAPIVEELFFRGFLFNALQRVWHWVPSAIVGGLVFGGIHAGGTPAIFLVPLAVLGFLLCFLYKRLGSVLPGMGVHAFNNALTLGVGLSWSAGKVLILLVLAPAVVIALASRVAD
jgi:membrane protease YdiL (CAAX protease family)